MAGIGMKKKQGKKKKNKGLKELLVPHEFDVCKHGP